MDFLKTKEKIRQEIIEVNGIDIENRCKKKEFVAARHVYFKIMCKLFPLVSHRSLCRAIGYQKYTSGIVLHYKRTFKYFFLAYPEYKKDYIKIAKSFNLQIFE